MLLSPQGEHTPPIDGETFIAGILDRFRQARESQQ